MFWSPNFIFTYFFPSRFCFNPGFYVFFFICFIFCLCFLMIFLSSFISSLLKSYVAFARNGSFKPCSHDLAFLNLQPVCLRHCPLQISVLCPLVRTNYRTSVPRSLVWCSSGLSGWMYMLLSDLTCLLSIPAPVGWFNSHPTLPVLLRPSMFET